MSCKHLTPLKTQCSENTVGNMFKNAMNSNQEPVEQTLL